MRYKQLLITTILSLGLCLNSFAQDEKPNDGAPVGDFIIQLANNFEAKLKNSSTGWGYQIWQQEELLLSQTGGFRIAAIDAKDGAAIAFSHHQRMHIASVSKAITAIATAKILEKEQLTWDTKIKNFLPENWTIHPTLAPTTFADLVEMKSGLIAINDAKSSSYHSLKKLVANGIDTSEVGKFNYQNISYGLLRVLIGALNRPDLKENSDTTILETASANSYVDFVNKMIFNPAKIAEATCRESSPSPTLMYPFPYHDTQAGLLTGFSGSEIQDGDLTNYAGGLGWYLSIEDLGKLLSTLFYTDHILSPSSFEALQSRSFPFNKGKKEWGEFFSGMGMWIWNKPGKWYNCGLNTVYVLFPNDIILVAFVNSKGKGVKNLRFKALSAYEESLKD